LAEKAIIDNLTERAIIKSFEYLKKTNFSDRYLDPHAIKRIARDIFHLNESDSNVQKRIEELCKSGILIAIPPCESKQSSGKLAQNPGESKNRIKNRIYRLNDNIEFEYASGPLPSETKSVEIPAEIRRKHTSDLKEAIRTWISSYSEPKVGNPFQEAYAYRKEIELCEDHPLFMDLTNHLSLPEYEVCSKWEKYKLNIETLEKDKWILLHSIEDKIQECFGGLDLRFIPDSEYGMEDYYCTFIHVATYYLILNLCGRVKDEEAWDAYEHAIYDTKANTKLIENGSIKWALKMEGDIIQVPKEKQDILMKGIDNYILFLENIEKSSLIANGKDIMREVNALRQERDAMIRELKDALLHFSFPGDCKYLVGS
jgi:hypothetical protein